MAEHDRRITDHDHVEIGQIIDILKGPLIPGRFGEADHRKDGLVDTVDQIKQKVSTIERTQQDLARTGVGVNLPTWSKWAAFVLVVVNIGSGLKGML